MSDLIQVDKFPVKNVLKRLLEDKTTGKNIIFATDMYSHYGYKELDTMTEVAILGLESCDIQPRVRKAQAEQNIRTRKKAEVFTPTWICNMMNNHCDREWFGREDIFNSMDNENHWTPSEGYIEFTGEKTWQKYVDSRRLEITCGEAPYLVSRYDTTTGEAMPIKERIGLLDRKLRVVNENAGSEEEWLKWAYRAIQSVYGYEFQGDNLLIARINLLITFCDYLKEKWNRDATKEEVEKAANIIAWNIWQMDGLLDTVPVGIPEEKFSQLSFFIEDDETDVPGVECRIMDWRSDRSKVFGKLKDKSERGVNMKFDFVIGNPPYQDESNLKAEVSSDNKRNFAPPIYNIFLEESYKVANCVEMIHPARFLFNAGSTPKAWNEKMLGDPHLQVLYYDPDSNNVFPGLSTPIKGGIAITHRNVEVDYGAIGSFSQYNELNSIQRKVKNKIGFVSLCEIIFSRTAYRLTDIMHVENPFAITRLSKGHAYDMSSNIFSLLPEIFYDEKPTDDAEYVRLLGRENNQRVYKFVKRKYVNDVKNLQSYKVFIPQATGSGAFGETFSKPFVETPNTGSTETFISIGDFSTEYEAKSLQSYIQTKFARALLGILKVTQNGNKPVWRLIPLQDFTPNSDIDWSVSISEIDKQLYKKYDLTQEEIDFIESHVKEMS